MKVKIFHPNAQGKIEFTRAELEKLLNEIYEEGKKDCEKNHPYTWAYPFIYNTPYCSDSLTSTTTVDKTINNKTASIDNLTCKCNCDTTDNKSVSSKLECDCNCTASVSKAETISTEKENNPFTYTIELGTIDTDTLNKAVNEMINNARNALHNQATRKDNDPYAKLAQELNF